MTDKSTYDLHIEPARHNTVLLSRAIIKVLLEKPIQGGYSLELVGTNDKRKKYEIGVTIGLSFYPLYRSNNMTEAMEKYLFYSDNPIVALEEKADAYNSPIRPPMPTGCLL